MARPGSGSCLRLEPLPGTQWLHAEGETWPDDAGTDGQDAGKFQVSVQGFDYCNTGSGNVDSDGANRIALWMLDPDYDGRSLFARQALFPMDGARDDWPKLARTLRAGIDETQAHAYRDTVSFPFEPGEHGPAEVKIV